MIALAWKNIWRQKQRTLLAVSAVALASLLTPLLFGFLSAWQNGMFEHLTARTGHLLVRRAQWQNLREFESLLMPEADVAKQITETLDTVQVATLLELHVLLAEATKFRMVPLTGLAQPPVLAEPLKQNLVAGRLSNPASLEEIVVSASLANALEVGLGDSVYAYLAPSKGVGAAAFKVVGVFRSAETSAQALAAYTSLIAAQDLAAPGEVTAFKLFVPDVTRLDSTQLAQLRQTLAEHLDAGLSVTTWQEANPDLATVLDLLEPVFLFLSLIFYGLAGLLVLNTVYLSLIERIREFGLILALGAGRAKIVRLVLTETVFVVLTGALTGGTLSLLILRRLSQGFSLPFGLAQVYAQFGLPTVLYANLSLDKILMTSALIAATALLAALWPAWFASRLEPTTAMRFAG